MTLAEDLDTVIISGGLEVVRGEQLEFLDGRAGHGELAAVRCLPLVGLICGYSADEVED